tara:strand:+ start:3412 stop:5064 length:1653 start_codon:yes stop_codon:yes gene_type:complete
VSKILVKQEPTLEDYGMSMQQPVNHLWTQQQLLNDLRAEHAQQPITEPKFLPQTRPVDQEALNQEITDSIQDYYFSPLYGGEPTDKNIPTTGRELIDDYYDTIHGEKNALGTSDLRSLKYTRDEIEARIREKVGQSEEGKNLEARYPGALYHEIREHNPLMNIHGRQSTLPEQIPAYHTENWQNPDGSTKEGAVAPINALKRLDIGDIERMMANSGLLPSDQRRGADNEHFENSVIQDLVQAIIHQNSYSNKFENNKHREPFFMAEPGESRTGAGFFVSPTDRLNMERAVSMSDGNEGFVGIRGLNTVDDHLQMRPVGGQREKTAEGYVSSRIPAERLVPIRVPTPSLPKELQPAYPGQIGRDGLMYPYKNKINHYTYPNLKRRSMLQDAEKRHSQFSDLTDDDIKRRHLQNTLISNLTKPFMEFSTNKNSELDHDGLPKLSHGESMTPEEKINYLENPNNTSLLRLRQNEIKNNPERMTELPSSWGSKQASLDKLTSKDLHSMADKLRDNRKPVEFMDSPGTEHTIALNRYIDKLRNHAYAKEQQERGL